MTYEEWEEVFVRNRVLGLFRWLQRFDERLAQRDAVACNRLLTQILGGGYQLLPQERRVVTGRECAAHLALGGSIDSLSALLSERAQVCRAGRDLAGAVDYLYRLGLACSHLGRTAEARLLLAQSRDLGLVTGNAAAAGAATAALAVTEAGAGHLEGLWRRDLFGEEAPVEFLADSIEDADWRWRRQAMLALVEAGDTAPLARCLRSTNVRVRMDAAAALEKACDPRTVDDLIGALRDEHWFVRWRAAVALGEIGDPRARIALEETLSDPDPDVRTSAIEALGSTGDQGSLRVLRAVGEVQDSAGRSAKQTAAWAIQAIEKRVGSQG